MNKLSDVANFLPLDNIWLFEAQLDFLLENEVELNGQLEKTICTIFDKSPNFTKCNAVQAKCMKLFVKYSELASETYMRSIINDEFQGCLSLRASHIEALSLLYMRSGDWWALERFCEVALEDPSFDGTADCVRMSVAVSLENLCHVFKAHRCVMAYYEVSIVGFYKVS